MNKATLQLIPLTLIMLLIQVVCNKILIAGVAMPIVFIYIIMRFPVGMSINWVMVLSFLMGLVVDVFNNTPGMHALSCTLLAALRLPVFNLYFTREDDTSMSLPSIASMGLGGYFKYMATLTILYCAILFAVQAFTLRDGLLTLMRIGASSLLSIVLILGIDTIVSTRREKRL